MKWRWRKLRPRIGKVSWRDLAMFVAGMVLAATGAGFIVFARDSLITPLAPEKAGGITTTWIPDTVRRWDIQIGTVATRYNIDPNLLAIIMTMESGGYSRADSGQAEGLMQIAPATAGDIAKRYLKQSTEQYDIWDPQTNIEFGAAYLAKLRDIYGTPQQGPFWTSTVELIAAAYNGGFGAANALEQGEGLGDPQTVVYSRDAFNMWRERHAAKSPTFERWKERGGSQLIEQAAAEMRGEAPTPPATE